jgi:hypothetical protein
MEENLRRLQPSQYRRHPRPSVRYPPYPCCRRDQSTQKARSVKVYKNPHSGEVVETKGGNHKVLKEWKAEYASEQVESWLSE